MKGLDPVDMRGTLCQELYKLRLNKRALVMKHRVAVASKERTKLRRVGKEAVNDRV